MWLPRLPGVPDSGAPLLCRAVCVHRGHGRVMARAGPALVQSPHVRVTNPHPPTQTPFTWLSPPTNSDIAISLGWHGPSLLRALVLISLARKRVKRRGIYWISFLRGLARPLRREKHVQKKTKKRIDRVADSSNNHSHSKFLPFFFFPFTWLGCLPTSATNDGSCVYVSTDLWVVLGPGFRKRAAETERGNNTGDQRG